MGNLRWSVWRFNLKDCSEVKSDRSVCRYPAEDLVSTTVCSQLKMLWFKQLWYNLHCAKWSASRFFWVSPVTHLPRHSAAFWAAGLGMVKPIWRKGAPQHPFSLETLSWRNTPSYSSSPLLILVQPWGSWISAWTRKYSKLVMQTCQETMHPFLSRGISRATANKYLGSWHRIWHKTIYLPTNHLKASQY